MSLINRSTNVADFTGRTLTGVAYEYEHPSRVTDDGWATSYYEEILRGADTRTLRHRASFPLAKLHTQQGGGEVGNVTFEHSKIENALLFTATVNHGRAGDELLEQWEEWRDASVTYEPLLDRHRTTPYHGRIVQRAEIRIHELALSPLGTGLAAGSGVLALRSAIQEGTPRLDALRAKRARLLGV